MATRTLRNSLAPNPLPRRAAQLAFLFAVWLLVYAASLLTPPLLDDADATHAQAAQAMLRTGDWVTLHVDGIRYLEKPPLPYWITAASLRLFGNNSFAVHLPLALTVLGLAALGWLWGRHAFRERAGFYAALFTLTSLGVFLFTRVFIPDALLSLLLCGVLYLFLQALGPETQTTARRAYLGWALLAAAVLTKGLVAPVFVLAAMALYLPITGEARQWRQLRPFGGVLLFVALAAPWHILAGLRNTGGADGHGFFWFYFINEHVLRFLGRRYPPDYNKLPALLYWALHLLWLFPWSCFAPVAAVLAWRERSRFRLGHGVGQPSFGRRSVLLLSLFAAVVLVFFSVSTNQEYYTLPAYLPLLLLLAAALRRVEEGWAPVGMPGTLRGLLLGSQAAVACVGVLAAAALLFGLWTARGLPAAPDVGDLLAHRGVGDYTLSMSHFFDLTGASFSALRLPATLACVALGIGPVWAWRLRRRQRDIRATVAVAGSVAVLMFAAHVALNRFSSMLSSADFAKTLTQLEDSGAIAPDSQVLLFGDQALGSSMPFYLQRRVGLVDGRTTSMIFGSTFPDAPPIFETSGQLVASWGVGPRKVLFVPLEHRAEVDRLLGSRRQVVLDQSSGKWLLTDRPLAPGSFATKTSLTPTRADRPSR